VRNPPESSSDLRPNYLDRIQPYGIFVPTGVGSSRPVPLTLLLHSLNTQHNQYAAWNPTFLQALCQGRHSICLVPFARGPDSWFFDEGETDIWETWNRVARDYPLDPSRTIIAGYSMGGYGTYRVGLEHPDLFAQAVAMAGPPSCAVRLWYPVEVPADPGVAKCEHEADTSPLVGNARQLPFYIAQGAVDELVFSPSAVQQSQLFDALGYRYRFELYARQGHVSWAETGHFDGAVAWLRDRRLAATPAHINYTFYASHQRRDLGSGPTGAWWVEGLRARAHAAGAKGVVVATSHALPDSTAVPVRSIDALMNSDGPAAVQQVAWGAATRASSSQRIDLELKGVRAISIDAGRGGLHGPRGLLHVTTDGPTRLSITGLPAGTTVSHGNLDQTLPRGSTDLELRWLDRSSAASAAHGALAATGPTLPLWPAGLLLLPLALTRLNPRRSRATS
jgi:predicted esterase